MNILAALCNKPRRTGWSVTRVGTSKQFMRGIATDGTTWITTASYTSGNRYIKYTNDPQSGTWHNNSDSDLGWYCAAYGNGYWLVGFHDPQYATTPSGTWTVASTALVDVEAITYGDGHWVAVGGTKAPPSGNPGCVTASTPNGTWTTNSSGIVAGEGLIKTIAYDGSANWVRGASNGEISTATNPTSTWTVRHTVISGYGVNGVAYGNGVWVAVCDSGKLYTSTNSTSWASRTSGFGTTNINAIAYGNGLWIAVGDSGKMTSATDPTVSWSTMTSNFNGSDINDIGFNSGLWVAVGDEGYVGTYRPS